MKVALYVRESSADTNKAPSIDEQITRGKQWVKENGYELIKVYSDNGYSGGDWTRPDWIQCVKDAKRHLWNIVWVWNQDRIARDTEQFLWFNRNLKDANIKIWEDTSNSLVDTDSLGNKIKHTTLAQAGEIFRLVTSDKVKKAYQRKKANGEHWGRNKIYVDVNLAIELKNQGLGFRRIAKEMNLHYQTVRRALLNRVIVEHAENTKN